MNTMADIDEPTPEETAAEVEAHGVRDLQDLPSEEAAVSDAPADSTLSLTVCT
jgi:hypothetical protein